MNRSRYTVTFSAEGVAPVTVLLDQTPANIPSGYGGWTIVQRMRKIGLSVWQGKDPLRFAVPVLFDGYVDGESQEILISRLSRMALPPQSGGEPPVVSVQGAALPSPGPVQWVIENLAWGTNVIWGQAANGVSVRLRQDCVVNLMQYVADDRTALKPLQPSQAQIGKSKVGWPKSYRVRKGDTLNKIASRYYGNSGLWKKIATANKIRDPKSLKVGQKLRIPAP